MSTRRDKRKQKFKARRRPRATLLNLVSLMDIFTILVFFLLVNASTAEVLPSPKNILLPEAGADKLPALNLVIAVDDRVIRLQGKQVEDERGRGPPARHLRRFYCGSEPLILREAPRTSLRSEPSHR